jgi:hypothetical protein
VPKHKFIRLGVLAAVAALASASRSSVVVAQEGPTLVPFRGLIDHVSVNMNGWAPTSSVDAGAHALVASPAPATLGSVVTLTATVTGSNHQAPSGPVAFLVNGSVVGSAALSASGSVTATMALAAARLPHGTHAVEVVYLGDTTYRASATKISLVVN